MKNLYFFLSLVLFSKLAFAQCPTTEIQFTTQQQINNFAINYPLCTDASNFNLYISGNDITNVDGFINLTKIKEIGIFTAPNLANLEGLANITTAGGIQISGPNLLSGSLEDLEDLQTAGYLVVMGSNWTTLTIPQNLEKIENFVVLGFNSLLTNISSLSSLPAVSGRVDIYQNPLLSDCLSEIVCKGVEIIPGKFPESTVNDNAPGCNTNAEILANCEQNLPVDLASFKTMTEGKTAVLTWVTTSETNSSHFDIQRSANGINWKTLGTVAAQQDSKNTLIYKYVDKSPRPGNNYYRLKMVDLDRTYAYSSVQATYVNLPIGIIYPNPVEDRLVITGGESQNKAVVKIYDAAGKIVLTTQYTHEGIPVEKLGTGIYTATFEGKDVEISTFKFVKK